jgi:hypothetical protein
MAVFKPWSSTLAQTRRRPAAQQVLELRPLYAWHSSVACKMSRTALVTDSGSRVAAHRESLWVAHCRT